MLENVSKIIQSLRREYREQKAAFEKSATQLNLVTKTLTFQTSANNCRYSAGGIAFDYEDNERVVVTLTTRQGVSTLAKLEVSTDADTPPIVRRVPFANGARWIVSNAPKQSDGSWAPTHYVFTAQTLLTGTLAAKMIWED